MSEDQGSILGGLEQMGQGIVDTVSDVGSAAYDAAASNYHGAAAAADAFLGDYDGTKQHMDAAKNYADSFDGDLSDMGSGIVDGAIQTGQGVYNTASDLGSAAYDAAASNYHGAAAAGDAFLGDYEGTQQHMDAAANYADSFNQDLSNAASDSGADQIDPGDLAM